MNEEKKDGDIAHDEFSDSVHISYDDFMALGDYEKTAVLFKRQEYIISKIAKIEEISHKLDDMFGGVKPLLDKIPTDAIKEKANAFFGKFKKSEVVSPDMKNCVNTKD